MRLEMAASRAVTLRKEALAKLMLLEEFRPSAFKRLGQLQAEQDGKPQLLRQMEDRPERPKKRDPRKLAQRGRGADEKGADEASAVERDDATERPLAIDPDLEAWRADAWLRDWSGFDPHLADEDLRPYFYFSRDILGPSTGAVQRLSADAQEFVLGLLSESEATRVNTHSKAAELEEGDATAVLEDLLARAQGEDDKSADNSAFRAMFFLVEARKELAADLVTSLESFPEGAMPRTAPLLLMNTCKGTAAETAARTLLTRWSSSSAIATLKKASGAVLKRQKG